MRGRGEGAGEEANWKRLFSSLMSCLSLSLSPHLGLTSFSLKVHHSVFDCLYNLEESLTLRAASQRLSQTVPSVSECWSVLRPLWLRNPPRHTVAHSSSTIIGSPLEFPALSFSVFFLNTTQCIAQTHKRNTWKFYTFTE